MLNAGATTTMMSGDVSTVSDLEREWRVEWWHARGTMEWLKSTLWDIHERHEALKKRVHSFRTHTEFRPIHCSCTVFQNARRYLSRK